MSRKLEVYLWEILNHISSFFFCKYIYKHFCWCIKCSYYKLPLGLPTIKRQLHCSTSDVLASRRNIYHRPTLFWRFPDSGARYRTADLLTYLFIYLLTYWQALEYLKTCWRPASDIRSLKGPWLAALKFCSRLASRWNSWMMMMMMMMMMISAVVRPLRLTVVQTATDFPLLHAVQWNRLSTEPKHTSSTAFSEDISRLLIPCRQ